VTTLPSISYRDKITSTVPWNRAPNISLDALNQAILLTILYADIFDYPLTFTELSAYLAGLPVSEVRVRDAITTGQIGSETLTTVNGYVMLRGREGILAVRERRKLLAATIWPRARRLGLWIARFPFVRMVAVTGALAVDNVEPEADLDYLIVTESGRLWTCRALIILLVHLAGLHGDRICPNFLLSERALTFPEQDFYNAHELVQMVPLSGCDIYKRLVQANAWVWDYLPNARWLVSARQAAIPDIVKIRPVRQVEALLRSRFGAAIEGWEMNRKIEKFTRANTASGETRFGKHWCKGHFDGHANRIMQAFTTRLHDHGLSLGEDHGMRLR
jgi:hypothetical protein